MRIEETANVSDSPPTTRARNAAASTDALLQAARTLFGQYGYKGTTIREIGERAGVDGALIARYFGSKAALYIAAVAAEDAEGAPSQYENVQQMAGVVLGHGDRRGPGAILQAIARSDTSPEIREAALERVAGRLIDPLVAKVRTQGLDQPELRAQIAVCALYGVNLGRSLGWFDEIRSVQLDVLVRLVCDALDAVVSNVALDSPDR